VLPLQVGRALGELAADLGRNDEAVAGRLTYHWVNGHTSRHPVLRTAHCPDCARFEPHLPFRTPPTPQTRSGAPSDRRRILAVADCIVDEVTGLVRWVTRPQLDADAPQIQHAVASLADITWTRHGMNAVYCGGSDLDADAARAAAIGEALDRAAVAHPPPGNLIIAPYNDVKADAVDPRTWDLYHPTTRARPGFPYAPIRHDEQMSWVWGWSITRSSPALVPASRVFVPFEPSTPAEITDGPALSGSAAGSTFAEAALAGLLEVVERDSFMIAWANRLALRRLQIVRTSAHPVGAYVAAFEDSGLSVRCATLQLDLGIPLVVAMVRSNRPGDPASVLATSAALDPAVACSRSLKELAANLANVRHNLAVHPGPLPSPDPEQVIDETAHGLLFARPDMAVHTDPWWEPTDDAELPPARQVADDEAQLADLVTRIGQAGLEVFVVDLTPPEIKTLGLWMVRVLVPGTYPMNCDSRWPHQGGRRLRQAPVEAGILDQPLPFEQLNSMPHPFP
jgi:ribosomal protein S12 methylthiotransferase accessory factor